MKYRVAVKLVNDEGEEWSEVDTVEADNMATSMDKVPDEFFPENDDKRWQPENTVSLSCKVQRVEPRG